MFNFRGAALLFGASTLFAVGCDNKDDTGETGIADADTDTDADTDADTDTDTDTDADVTITIAGAGFDLAANAPVPEGTCIQIFDPTPVLSGGTAELLGDTTTGAGGAFSVSSIPTTSAVGLLMNVANCDDTATDPYPTNTGVLAAEYSSLADGATLGDKAAYSLSRPFMDGVDGSATAAGYGGTVSDDGVMIGFIFDSAGAPVDGATVNCGGCTVYYFDADPSDGLFTSAATGVNAAASGAAKSMFAIPAAGITSYSADDGGTHTWNATVAGSSAGTAVVVAFYAN